MLSEGVKMINAEYYKEKLLKFAEKDIENGLNSKGELVDCDEVDCTDCQWNTESTDCECEMIKWLLAEHKEYPKVTEYQYIILKQLIKEYNWCARDKSDALYFFSGNHKPEKQRQFGERWQPVDGIKYYLSECLDDFDFIKWTDEEPWNIQELLENCEVEE